MVAAALLIGALGVAFATSVSGQAFEHHADVTEAGQAYTIDWQQEDPGKLRLQFDPVDGAAEPTATMSLFSPDRELVGTYDMDADWRQLDYVIQTPGEHTLVVHEATGANIQILTEDDARADVEEAELDRDTVTLLEGQHQDLAYQLAIDADRDLAHMGVVFQGQASDLDLEVLGEDDQVILEAGAPALETQEAQALPTTLAPGELDESQLLVRLQAQSLNGTVALELLSFPAAQPEAVQLSTPADDDDGTEGNDTEAGNQTDANQSAEADWDPPVDGKVVTELEPDEPVAFEVAPGAEAVYLIGKDDRATATLYGPDDVVLDTVEISEDTDRAVVWDEDEDLVAIPVPVETDGEFVAMLSSSYDGLLFVADVDQTPEHRVLDLEAHEVTWDEVEEDRTLLISQETTTTGNQTLTGGLVAYSFETSMTDTHREVTLYGPDGEEIANGSSGAGSSFHDEICPEAWSVAGPAGDYTVEMESDSLLYSENTTATLVQYVR